MKTARTKAETIELLDKLLDALTEVERLWDAHIEACKKAAQERGKEVL